MKTEIKPNCICGSNNWQPWGASISSYRVNEGHKCASCGVTASYIQQRGGNVFVVWNGEESIEKWLNGPCRNVWAMRDSEIQKLKDQHDDAIRANIVKVLQFDPDKDTRNDEKMDAWRDAWGRSDKENPFVIPNNLNNAPELPRAPMCVYAFVWRHDKWDRVDPVRSATLPVPEHPLRISTFKTMAEVFAKVTVKTGVMISPEETDNEYCHSDIEPWFKFTVGLTDFKVGSRKRVYALKYSGKGPVKALAPLAKRDNVTFSDNEIHAWGIEKLVEYMSAAVEACNG